MTSPLIFALPLFAGTLSQSHIPFEDVPSLFASNLVFWRNLSFWSNPILLWPKLVLKMKMHDFFFKKSFKKSNKMT